MDALPMLAAQGLWKRFGALPVLKGLDLALYPGELTLLLGPNGAGKTTLTRLLSTLTRPSRGTLRYRGEPLGEKGRLGLRSELGYLSHQSFLYGHLTAEENLRFFGRLYGVKDLERRVEELLRQVGLQEARRRPAGTFSRGMQQRLALARVLLPDPPFLLLDEPYAGLDPEGSRTLTNLLTTLKDRRRAILLVTHEVEDCLPAADRVAILAGGRIAWESPAAGLTAQAVKERYFEVTGEGRVR
jgi:heme ABC exporter ATP-binding subunit CcmA